MKNTKKSSLPLKLFLISLALVLIVVDLGLAGIIFLNIFPYIPFKDDNNALFKFFEIKNNEYLLANPHEVGETVTLENIDWTIVSVGDAERIFSKNLVYYDYLTETCTLPSDKIIYIKFKIVNQSNQALREPETKVIDSNGHEYMPDTEKGVCAFDTGLDWRVNPGMKITGVLTFVVPKEATGLVMMVGKEKNIFGRTTYQYFKLY